MKPVPYKGRSVACKRCEPCRRTRAFFLATRLLVEGLAHQSISMVTLTYAPKHRPEGETLVPAHPREFQRRLRRRFDHHESKSLRFFTVGEYGTKGRLRHPHYHLITFGADIGTTIDGASFASVVQSCWGLGDVHIGSDWSAKTAGYLAGYVVKGHNIKGLDLLRGRHPEFSRFPQRPGLGVPGLPFLNPELVDGDVSHFVQVGNDHRLLGPYLIDKARQYAGLSSSEVAELKARALEVARLDARSAFPDRLADLTFGDVDELDFALSLFGSAALPVVDRPSIVPAHLSIPRLASLNRLLF